MRLISFLKLIGYYLSDLLTSNLIVARDIITPGEMGKPQILKMELKTSNDFHLFILMALITMTPGSLCLKISGDKKYVWLHYLYPDHTEQIIDTFQNKYQKLVMEIF